MVVILSVVWKSSLMAIGSRASETAGAVSTASRASSLWMERNRLPLQGLITNMRADCFLLGEHVHAGGEAGAVKQKIIEPAAPG